MKTLPLVLIILLNSTFLFSQHKIVGIIYEKSLSGSKKPIPRGASVFIPGVSSSTTDDKGYYSLDLSQCKECKAGTAVKIYVNSKIGYAEKEFVIPFNPALKPFDIEIQENGKLILNGAVRDKKTGKLLKGIKVNVLIQNGPTVPAVITNENGVFQVIIRMDGVTNMQAIQLFFLDEDNSKYKDMEKVVFINQYEPVKVEMEECTDCGARFNLDININIRSNIKVEPGDEVIIRASGIIKVGTWVGTSGPGGIEGNKGVLGVSLSDYNYFPNWNHGALVYRFGENDDWKYYDNKKENRYSVQTSGYIEFRINDKQQSDNSGAYQVEVIVKK